MPGRIGKTYPRAQPSPAAAAPSRRRRRRTVAAIGGLIAALSAVGLLGWLMFR